MRGSQFDGFISEIQKQKRDARTAGEAYIDVQCGTLQKMMGLKSHAHNCGRAMYQAMGLKDAVIEYPAARDGSKTEFGNRLLIRYYV